MVSDQRIGTELAGYRIRSLLGRGGMSAVYVAEDQRLKRQVALKILAPELAESPSFRDRFVRESQVAAGMEHPNIVPIYEAGEADGHLFIAMRWIRGTDLRALLEREGSFDPVRVARIGADVAAALDAAHAAGLVHRDVKPANILVIEGGGIEGRDLVYLSDFGLTKRLESEGGLTKTGQFVGTIDYVAPEQIEGKPVDARVDVYSLGCVLFECLTGKVPYGRETEVAALYAHLREKPPRLTQIRPDLPASVDKVFERALSKSPGHRYASAGELIDGLRTAIGVSSGERATVAHETPGGGRRRVGLVAGVLAVLAAIALAAVLTSGGSPNPSTSAKRSGSVAASPSPGRTFAISHRALSENEKRLMGFLPQAIRSSCGPFDQPSHDTLASIACNTTDARAVYGLYSTKGGMDAAFDQARDGLSAPSGDCASRTTAFATYTVDSQSVGRVLCDLSGTLSSIVWTDERVLVLGQAFRDDQADLSLYDWWLHGSGPVVEQADGSVVTDKDGSTPATPSQGTFMTSISREDATSERLRNQTEKISSNATSEWVGAWRIELGDGTYRLSKAETEYETGRFGLGKGDTMIFEAETGDPDCVAQGSVAYRWSERSGDIRWTDPAGVTGCIPGPWPVDLEAWIAPPTGEIAYGTNEGISTRPIAGSSTSVSTDSVQPAWSPDGSRLAFARRATDGIFELWVANADGTDPTRLTSGQDPEFDQLDPAWSPDGSWIAFHTEEDNAHSMLSLIHPDGTGRVDIVGPMRGNVGRPSWSPDGRRLAFRIDYAIYTVRADGAGMRRLVSDHDVHDVYDLPTAWTPDGEHVLFWGDYLGPTGMYSTTPTGGDVELLFRAPKDVQILVPDVSSDGRWVLLAGQWDPGAPTPLFVYDLDGRQLFQLSDELVSEPRWRPSSP